MPIRPDVVRRKLLDISETVSHLRSLLPTTAEHLERDVTLRWAIEHGLHLAAESLFDVGNHILAAEFQEVSDEYREILPRLVARSVITAATGRVSRALPDFGMFSYTTMQRSTFEESTPVSGGSTISTRSSRTSSCGSRAADVDVAVEPR